MGIPRRERLGNDRNQHKVVWKGLLESDRRFRQEGFTNNQAPYVAASILLRCLWPATLGAASVNLEIPRVCYCPYFLSLRAHSHEVASSPLIRCPKSNTCKVTIPSDSPMQQKIIHQITEQKMLPYCPTVGIICSLGLPSEFRVFTRNPPSCRLSITEHALV